MIDKNKKYKTRSGRDVTIMCTEARGNYPVIESYTTSIVTKQIVGKSTVGTVVNMKAGWT
jgi:hypothetical protein